jgi:hypothetical protein
VTAPGCRGRGGRAPAGSPFARGIGGAAAWRAHIALIRIHGITPALTGVMITKDFPFVKDLPLIRCFSFVIT